MYTRVILQYLFIRKRPSVENVKEKNQFIGI